MSDERPRLPDPRMIPSWEAPAAPEPAGNQPNEPAPRVEDVADEMLIRPFLVTGGRTRPLQEGLRIETMVFAQRAALSAPLRFEARRVVELCQRPMAIADVAVALGQPLGVTRVLVADLITDGYLRYEERSELSIELIERIRDRVRAL